jgi:eukaryotic-like serine/threonine-protein kinase
MSQPSSGVPSWHHRCPACGVRVSAGSSACPRDGTAIAPGPVLDVAPTLELPGFAVEQILGAGGFGKVFGARRISDGRAVAVKVARTDVSQAGARLAREAQVLEAVGEPHVPALLGTGCTADGTPFVAMELLPAPTLAALMGARGGAFPAGDAIRLLAAVLDALVAVHERGFVHRDLKPENVFMHADGHATLVDFGLVRVTGDLTGSSSTASRLTQAGVAIGSPEYMAPEQCDGLADIDVRVDVYAAGVILYELLAGRPPFFGPAVRVREGHRSHRPPPFDPALGVSPDLEAIVFRCLAKQRDARFADVAALRRSLLELPDQRFVQRPPARDAELLGSTPSAVLRSRDTLPVVYFDCDGDPLEARHELERFGATLAHVDGSRFAALMAAGSAQDPFGRITELARHFVERGHARAARLDVATVTVRARPDGSRRFVSAAFTRRDSFPDAGELGVTRSDRFREALVAPPSQRDVPLIGRAGELAKILAAAEASSGGEGPGITLVLGEAGLGKSRLFEAVRAQLSTGAADRVLVLRARETVLGDAGSLTSELLSSAPMRERVANVNDPLARAAIDLHLGRSTASGGPPAAPGALQSALARVIAAALREQAGSRGLLVLVDDAQFADSTALDALELATLADAGARIWIGVFARPSFERACPSFGSRVACHDRLVLDRLDAASGEALCRELLLPVTDVPAAAVARLVDRAGGVPMLLTELVRGLKRLGIVKTHADGRSAYLALEELDAMPDLPLVDWLAQRELGSLSPDLAAHARLLALLGAETTVEETAGVMRVLQRRGGAADVPLDAEVAARRLVAAGVLAPAATSDSDGVAFRFRHALVREAMARSASVAWQGQVHRAAFEHYAALVPARLAPLAYHAALAGEAEAAAQAYLELAESARARHAYVEAELLYSSALEQLAKLPDGATTSRVAGARRGRGLMRYRVGRYEDALGDLEAARAAAHREGDRRSEIELLLDEAEALDWMSDHRRSRERAELARTLAGPNAPPALEARLLLGEGRSLHRELREREASELLVRAAEFAESIGDDAYETGVIARLMLGFVLQNLGRLQEAQDALDRVIPLCEARGDRIHLQAALSNRALLSAFVRGKDAMLADFSRSLAIGRELGLVDAEFVIEYNTAEYLYLMDDVAGARVHLERATEACRRLKGGEGHPVAWLLRARIAAYEGDAAEARASAEKVKAICASSRFAGKTDMELLPSDLILLDAVELALSGGSDAAWNALEARSAESSAGQERLEILDLRALSLRRTGKREAASAAFRALHDLATTIPNIMKSRILRSAADPAAGSC